MKKYRIYLLIAIFSFLFGYLIATQSYVLLIFSICLAIVFVAFVRLMAFYNILTKSGDNVKYEELFNSDRDGIFVVNLDAQRGTIGKIIECNISATHLLGLTHEILKGLNIVEIFANIEQDKILNQLQNITPNEHMFFETNIKDSKGNVVPVEFLGHIFSVGKRKSMYITLRNITERRRLELERLANQNLLAQQSKMASIGEMIGVIAHQWKQPLNVIYLLNQELQDMYNQGEIDKALVDYYTKTTLSQIEFMSSTIGDFMRFFEPNKEKKKFNCFQAIMEVKNLLFSESILQNIKFSITRSNLCAYGYENEFKQVILNIINNAKDAFKENQSNRNISVDIQEDNKCVKIDILDNAGGIPQEIQDRIFEPYFSTKGSLGTGLGLYISKIIIEQNMSGALHIENVKSKNGEIGAKFSILLPMRHC